MSTIHTLLLNRSLLLSLLLFLGSFQCKNVNSQENSSPVVTQKEVVQKRLPLYIGRPADNTLQVKFTVVADEAPLQVRSALITFSDGSHFEGLSAISVNYKGPSSPDATGKLFGKATSFATETAVNGKIELGSGLHFLNIGFPLKDNPALETSFEVESIKLTFKNHSDIVLPVIGRYVYRPALVMRAAGQDGSDTYRIPGIITTNKGTLISVYDIRYNNSKDLQENIDIGMSRSTDGGQTWGPMKVIIDMGEYGGRPQQLNGAGDPCVLYDTETGTIWVAALWMSGSSVSQMLWWASQPGLKPEETGQFILAKSSDDGLTWSPAINITNQIKDPAWQLLLQGPGRGITMSDGTLVFPVQFKFDTGSKAIDGGQYTCHSSVIWSKDHGVTWHIGTGAKSNTTEAQVVELSDGSLMLNMRDDRNRANKGATNGRAVAVSKDLGQTWQPHVSSNSELPEPNCMASIISADMVINGKMQRVLLFSNPNNKDARSNMTIKASLDGGLTWPDKYHLELNAETGYGYSCLTMVDPNHVGILYEGIKELYFQKVPVKDILTDVQLNSK